MNRIVFWAVMPSRSFASAPTRRRAATPEETAETGSKWERVRPAMMRARVVLPEPGGPQRTIEGGSPASIALRRRRPSPTICSWPTNSSRGRGRMRAASGAWPAAGGAGGGRGGGGGGEGEGPVWGPAVRTSSGMIRGCDGGHSGRAGRRYNTGARARKVAGAPEEALNETRGRRKGAEGRGGG